MFGYAKGMNPTGNDRASSEQPSGKHRSTPTEHEPDDHDERDLDSLADEMSRGSFPTSDPPSTWAGKDRARDAS